MPHSVLVLLELEYCCRPPHTSGPVFVMVARCYCWSKCYVNVQGGKKDGGQGRDSTRQCVCPS